MIPTGYRVHTAYMNNLLKAHMVQGQDLNFRAKINTNSTCVFNLRIVI